MPLISPVNKARGQGLALGLSPGGSKMENLIDEEPLLITSMCTHHRRSPSPSYTRMWDSRLIPPVLALWIESPAVTQIGSPPTEPGFAAVERIVVAWTVLPSFLNGSQTECGPVVFSNRAVTSGLRRELRKDRLTMLSSA